MSRLGIEQLDDLEYEESEIGDDSDCVLLGFHDIGISHVEWMIVLSKLRIVRKTRQVGDSKFLVLGIEFDDVDHIVKHKDDFVFDAEVHDLLLMVEHRFFFLGDDIETADLSLASSSYLFVVPYVVDPILACELEVSVVVHLVQWVLHCGLLSAVEDHHFLLQVLRNAR